MKKWKYLAVTILLLVVLTGCGKTVEEQIDVGLSNVENTFSEESQESNKKIDDIELYLPSGYSIDSADEAHNFVIEKGSDTFLLFVNSNENQDSKLHYDLLKKDTSKKIIKEKTFEKEGVFAFAAIVEYSEEEYELIVSYGENKITTISENKKMDEKLADMMQIVQSVKTTKN